MYCYVFFGESQDNHTRKYLYKGNNIIPGDIVIVPTKDSQKSAFVFSLIDELPSEMSDEQVKNIICKCEKEIHQKDVTSYILALIDEYKDGYITKESFGVLMEHFVSANTLDIDKESDLYAIVESKNRDACIFGVDEPRYADDGELYYWKEIKDVEYRLRYGRSFWEKSKWSHLNEDPSEKTDEYLRIELELERLIRNEIGEGGYMGFCHKYWYTKKIILSEKYGIEWKSPIDMNPGVIFD